MKQAATKYIFIIVQTNSFVRTFHINIIHDCGGGGGRCSRSNNFSNKTQTKTVQIDLYYMILNKNGNLLICHYMKYERMVISIIAKLLQKLLPRLLHHKHTSSYLLCLRGTGRKIKILFKMLHVMTHVRLTHIYCSAISQRNGTFLPFDARSNIYALVEHSKLPNKIKLLTNFSMCMHNFLNQILCICCNVTSTEKCFPSRANDCNQSDY